VEIGASPVNFEITMSNGCRRFTDTVAALTQEQEKLQHQLKGIELVIKALNRSRATAGSGYVTESGHPEENNVGDG
jgi:hypothetical protein